MTASNTDTSPVSKSSTVTLREITKDNWRAVIDLKVAEGQEGNVSPNVKSLCESHYSEDAWVRAIYADETAVGFLMMSIWPPEPWYCIWRFMIDERYQKLGFGRQSILLAKKYIQETYPEARLLRLLSTGPEGKKDVPKEHSPYNFYYSLGFREIEPMEPNGQVDMGMDI